MAAAHGACTVGVCCKQVMFELVKMPSCETKKKNDDFYLQHHIMTA